MPAASARSTGSLNAVGSTSETAMPSTFALIALLKAFTISLTLLLCDPVHWYEQPSSVQASWAPYRVGTKNGFVVTWLMTVNLSGFWEPNTRLAPDPDAADAPLPPPPPHELMRNAARPAAPPASAVRLVDCHRSPGASACEASARSRPSITSRTWSSPDMLASIDQPSCSPDVGHIGSVGRRPLSSG